MRPSHLSGNLIHSKNFLQMKVGLTPFVEILAKLGLRLVQDDDSLYKVGWEQCWMGCKPSPFFETWLYYWV
jgi:hypothetical protein